MNKPLIQTIGDAMRFVWGDGIQIELDRFYDGHGDISAEATIYSEIMPNPGLIHTARLNLMSTQARATLSKQLATRVKSVDWPGLLEQLCYLAVNQYRDGDPPVDLRYVQVLPQRWIMYPYLEHGGPTLLYAEGGSCKSIIALWMALHIGLGARDAQGRVQPSRATMYLDYETSGELHAERLAAIVRGLDIDPLAVPPMMYRRMRASLPQAAASLRKDIAKCNIGMVVVDSLGMAGDGPPEEAGTAIALFQAIRSLDVPTLCIHHKRKGNGMKGESQRDRLFGSAYYLNFPRIVWEAEAIADEDTETLTPKVAVALVNVKINNGRLLKRHGLQVQFENTADGQANKIFVSKVDLAKIEEMAHKVPLRDRIAEELRGGARTAQELSESLDVQENTLRVKVSQMKTRGELVSLPGHQWGLATHDDGPPI